MTISKKNSLIILMLILIGGFLVRLYRFDGPIADWHSWRQADTSAVSRNFVNKGFDVLRPRFDDLSNVPSGKDNPQGYRFVEFPIFNIKQAFLYKYIGVLTLEEWGRMINILGSSLSALFLYLIVARHSRREIGLLSAFFYMLIPYNIYYGRTILPDPLMVTASLGGAYFFDLYLARHSGKRGTSASRISKGFDESDSGHLPARQEQALQAGARMTDRIGYLFYLFAIIFTACAFLLKPYALFFTLPMLVLAYQKFGLRLIKKWQLWVFAILSIAPLIFWRWWMLRFPEGIPSSTWLLNGNGIRFHPAFFRWILYERITKLISGYLGALILAVGVLVPFLRHPDQSTRAEGSHARNFRLNKILRFASLTQDDINWALLYSFLLSSIIYVTTFATGNVQHDYYQILIMPSVSIFFAIGSLFLFHLVRSRFGQYTGILVISIIIAASFYFSWKQVKDYFNINNPSIIAAGKAVDRLTPKDAKVIANYTGDTSFLYQTKRQGWASFEKPLPEMVQMGASYLVLVNPTEKDMVFAKTYKVVEKNPQYVIFELRKR